MDNTPDKGIVTLMKGIKTHESGGNYNQAPETAGTSLGGAYMYQKPTWQGYARDTVGDSNLPFTPENQDKVTYLKIKQWKDQGLTPEQIISKWNPGAGQSYVNMVKKAITGKSTQSNIDTSPTPTTPPPTENKPQYSTPQHSPERIAQYNAEQQGYDEASKKANSKGNILGETIKGISTGVGDAFTFGGASQLGEQLGTGLAKTTNQVRGLLGGIDNSKYMDNMDFGKTTAGLAKTVAGTLLTAGGAGELKGILSGPKALTSAEVLNGVKAEAGIAPKIFSNASPIKQYDYLHEALQNVGGRLSGSQLKAIQNAINELEPIVSKLLPGASKMELGNILKWGAGKVGRGLWNLVKTTATGAGFYELGAGGKHIKGLLGLDNLTN